MKPEILRVIIALLAVTLLIFGALMAASEEARNKKGPTILYILIAGMCLGILGFARFLGLRENLMAFFIILQVLMLVLGIVHQALLKRITGWNGENTFFGELFLTMASATAGGIFLMLALVATGMKNFAPEMLSSLVWFLVPFAFTRSIGWYDRIPKRIFKTWSYPVDNPYPDPSDSELASPLVISFEFMKKTGNEEFTQFRAKAPKDLQFGKLFYYFINDYNSRHPESTIEIADATAAFPWVFHFKPRFLVRTRYLDPDETVFHNQIRENSVIVCKRIIEP
jgi:hypothetical protein